MFAGDFVKIPQKRTIFRSDGVRGEKNVSKRVFVPVAKGLEIEEKRLEFRF